MTVFVLGSINLDAVARVDDLPRPGETVAGLSLELFLGGKGANQAVAAARMGVATRLMGAVGGDDSGASLKAKLAGYGVQVGDVVELPGVPTGQAHVWVANSAENMIVVTAGANAMVTPQQVAATPIEGQRVLLCQLETPATAIETLFRAGSAKGALRILNAAPALPQGAALFPLTDILIVNQTELATYAKLDREPVKLEEVSVAARKLMSRPDQTIIVTLGAAGAAVVRRDEAFLVEGKKVKAVDTVGAGDCFCGALAATLAAGMDLAEAVETANAAAALSVQKAGAAPSMPNRREVEAFLEG
ncbi:ribokinase [Caulobacter vibrioides]|uniref:ribokinase n=1 Tax=Caulobacter vibrioides TaxID=155892 RepID=UPI000BB4992E|nr:ribokinase [Caulobacter vibrioides]ATC23908.1 ribokinase [Caulobacter vibrioides]AZH12146.1 ribokinase [Caulobacter vibrioides]PLR15882.1 ribokinase [Caulobacter vibrioides]